MSDLGSRNEDLERTDVLPQLGVQVHDADDNETTRQPLLASPRAADATGSQPMLRQAIAPFGSALQTDTGGKIQTLPVRPSPTDLAVGGIRGKIADLESRLIEAQDHQIDLNRYCEQLTQRCRAAEERATKAEANYVVQSSDLYRAAQRANDAEQSLVEQRVRFEAQLVIAEQQLVEARARADKRAATLEQLLGEQTERASQSDRASADTRVEAEKMRAELSTAQTAVRDLEQRLTTQTQAASDISKLYAQQTAQVSSLATTMAQDQKKVLNLEATQAENERQILALSEQLRLAEESAVKVQADMVVQKRHIGALEQGLVHRDRSVDELKAMRETHERAYAELGAAKAELERQCGVLQKALTDAEAIATNRQEESVRLAAIVQHHEVRAGELTAAQHSAEQRVRDRDAVIADSVARAQAAKQEYAQLSAQAAALRERLEKQEQDIDGLQTQLQTRTAELETARTAVLALQQQQIELSDDRNARLAEFDTLKKTAQKLLAERDQLELENQAGRGELSRAQERYEEAVKTLMGARETISVREQQKVSLERELRAVSLRLEDANDRIARAVVAAESLERELRERDGRIVSLEQKLNEHASALSAIGQDIERVNAASPNERLSAMGFALESLDQAGVVHRLTRMTTTAGRSDSNDIQINSTSVSRYHARIVVKPEGVWLIDLQSTNGCGVNGRRISRQILCDGDAVMIGHCKFRFSVLGVEAVKSAHVQELQPTDTQAPILPLNAGAENRVQHH